MTLGFQPAPAPVAPMTALSAPACAFAPPLSLAPSFAAAPVLEAAPAPALPALRAAAIALPEPSKAPAEEAREAAAVSFEEAPALSAPAVDAGEGRRPRYRLAPLGFGDLDPSAPDGPPAPLAPEPKPFLLRHYRLLRFFAAPLVRLVYAVDVRGLEHLPAGPALIVPNHVSFMDPVLLSFAANRSMRFLMYRGIYETFGLQWLFRSLGAIPISPKDPKDVIEASLYRARRALASGETVVVFPEGRLTTDGELSPFRRGFERVAAGTGAPVIPARVDGMWGSAFSRHPRASLPRGILFRLRGRRTVAVGFGPELPRADIGLARDAVVRLTSPIKKQH